MIDEKKTLSEEELNKASGGKVITKVYAECSACGYKEYLPYGKAQVCPSCGRKNTMHIDY